MPRQAAKKQRGVRIDLLGVTCDTLTMTVSVPPRGKVALIALMKYVLSVAQLQVEMLHSLGGTLNWLRNPAPNLHPAFGAVRNAIKEHANGCSWAPLPGVARAELSFFVDFAGDWDGVNFFPECPRLLLGADASGCWRCLLDFPEAGGLPPRLLSMITSDAAGGIGQSLNVFGCVSYYPAPFDEAHINVEEFIAAARAGLAAMALFLDEPRPLHVCVGCDNTSAIAWLRSGLSDIPLVQQGLAVYYRFLFFAETQISFVYVRSADNKLADAGSRQDIASYMAALRDFEPQHGCVASSSHPAVFVPRGPSFVGVRQTDDERSSGFLGGNLFRQYNQNPPVSRAQARGILFQARQQLLALHRL